MDARHPVRRDPEPDYLEAEWREVPDDPPPAEPSIPTVNCPHCGKLAAPVFGVCYHCFQPLRPAPQPKGFWDRLESALRAFLG